MIQLKSSREIEIMAKGGRILGKTLRMLASRTVPGVTTGELDQLADEFIRSHKGAVAAFKGLYGFPGSTCLSINQEIVHGIPSPTRVLREGDILSIDVGVKYEGYYTDAAITVGVGRIQAESERLLAVTQEALAAGIAAALPGNHSGDIGAAISAVVHRANFSLAKDLVGHGVGLEPMVNLGVATTRTMPDKWTVVTADGKRSAHFEHTVAITEDGPRVLTAA